MKLTEKLKQNDIIATFISLKGNPKACVATEPLWFIPYNLFAPFASVYMRSLGLTPVQIGSLVSIGMMIQIVSCLFGGIITDKVGRRKTTALIDCLSWTIPCLLWALAQNFWWFLGAVIFNSLMHICTNSWNCLLVEDCPEEKLVNVFSLIQLCGLLAAFFAPISALLVEEFSVVPVVRGLYIFSCISMTAKFVLLYLFSTETKQGEIRREETKNESVLSMLLGYKQVIKRLFSSRAMLLVLLVMTTYTITDTNIQTFFGVYITETLANPEKYLAVFPIVRSAIMLIFILGVQAVVNRLPYRPVMTVGYLMFILSHILLIIAPSGNIPYLILYSLLEACSLACIMPRKESLNALLIDKQERSRITGLIFVMMLLISAPFGWLNGFLFDLDGCFPFVLNIVIFTIVMIAVLSSREITKLDRSIRQGNA